MKKNFAIFFLFFVSSLGVIAQENNAKKWTLSVGYGIGNVWVYFLKNNSLINDLSDYKVNGMGPVTVCIENQVSHKISIGVSAAYSIVRGETKRFLAEEQISIFTVLARANYHFGHSKKFDPYIGGGLGYVRSVYKNNLSVPGPVPGEFGYSAQIGSRYYVTKSFGAYGELGYVNGSFLQLGLCLQL